VSAPLVIESETTIDAGEFEVTLSGNDQVRLFTVSPGASLTLAGLTLTRGQSEEGGAIHIQSGASVVLTNCAFIANQGKGTNGISGRNGGSSSTGNGGDGRSGAPGIPGRGGAIYNLGELVLLRCSFSTNSAVGGNGGKGGNGGNGAWNGGNGGRGGLGAPGHGGAIYNAGALFLRDCSFAGNSASGGHGGAGGTNGLGAFPGLPGHGAAGAGALGAAIFSSSSITALNSTFVGNTALAGHSAAAGTEVSGNGRDGARGADALGGGICNLGEGAVTNSTFYFNRVLGGNGGNGGNGDWAAGSGGNGGTGSGGGIYSSGDLRVVNCTLSMGGAWGGTNGVAGLGLSSGVDGRRGFSYGGNLARAAGNFWLKNTIIATNLFGSAGYGAVTDAGHNLSSDRSLALGNDSMVNTDPLLGPLADNGGPTRTMVPLPGSPAIGKGDIHAAPDFDQRDFERPGPGKDRPDIGALEGQGPSITTQPQSTTRTNGGSATLSVSVGGDSPFRYQWRFNENPIPRATNATLTVSNLSVTNSGAYDVAVSNAFGAVISAKATLQILQAPSFVWTGASSNTFSYAFQTQPGLSYVVQYKDSVAATNWITLRTNLGSGLIITNSDAIPEKAPARFQRLLVR
jgi:hypothetical protein